MGHAIPGAILASAAAGEAVVHRLIALANSIMTKPNFFILGAPKCGTTSLAAWLSEHPQIYLSPEKEPHFFNTDHKRFLNSLEAYEQLFADATPKYCAVGEASVWYLFSAEAVPNILAYNENAKFVVMLRNPVDMAPSLHEELVFTGREDVKDFAEAWRLQDKRREGWSLPLMVWEPKYVQYGDMCRLGEQVERLLGRVPRHRVKIVLLEELARDPRAVYRSILKFLNVADDGRTNFPVHNQAKKRRWPWLLPVAWAVTSLKHALGVEGGLGIWTRIDYRNRIERPRAAIAPAMRAELSTYFDSDIELLQRLIGRDLSHWRKPVAKASFDKAAQIRT
jgi:Sulfotransferase domain